MAQPNVVSSEQWLAARKELLAKEKEFTRLRDELSDQIRSLPWKKVKKEYNFQTKQGFQSLTDLFAGRSQLIVYHFMFGPEWQEGCKSCSLIADHYDPLIVHLADRDVSLVTISRAPLEDLLTFRERMGWTFDWVSSLNSEFNWDFQVSFAPEELEQGKAKYNYVEQPFPVEEGPGLSVFYKDKQGQVYHTYSTYARGLETFLGVYRFLDIVPNGRDEGELTYGMEWVRHHDRYGDASFVDPYKELIQIALDSQS